MRIRRLPRPWCVLGYLHLPRSVRYGYGLLGCGCLFSYLLSTRPLQSNKLSNCLRAKIYSAAWTRTSCRSLFYTFVTVGVRQESLFVGPFNNISSVLRRWCRRHGKEHYTKDSHTGSGFGINGRCWGHQKGHRGVMAAGIAIAGSHGTEDFARLPSGTSCAGWLSSSSASRWTSIGWSSPPTVLPGSPATGKYGGRCRFEWV